MSELLDNRRKRKEILKHMILQLHKGEAPEVVKKQLSKLLGKIPYHDVVEVEQELISEGLPQEEVLKLCDVHSEALKGNIDRSMEKPVEPGHPISTFLEENKLINTKLKQLEELFSTIETLGEGENSRERLDQVSHVFDELTEIDKHYRRKENLLFPFLEKHGITGPSSVMWGKHDEIRELLKTSRESLKTSHDLGKEEIQSLVSLVLMPTVKAMEEMIFKEEEILFPMSLDTLNEIEWDKIYTQSPGIGFCFYEPQDKWKTAATIEKTEMEKTRGEIQLPSGSLTKQELVAILDTLPVEISFVDKNGHVRYFNEGKERIFDRPRAILGRKVQQCHPPKSIHVVEHILRDFESGKEDHVPFWIDFKGKFIHIEYFAVRDSNGNYMGTLEVTQDLTEKRKLEGEQRLLQYSKGF